MMNVYLTFWNRVFKDVDFDIKKGNGSVILAVNDPKICYGFAYKSFFCWYAIWKKNDELFFQYRKKIISINNDYLCVIKKNRVTAKMQIIKEKKIIFSTLIFKPLIAWLDVTYDEMDFETDNFFYYIYKIWNDNKWRQDLILGWKSIE